MLYIIAYYLFFWVWQFPQTLIGWFFQRKKISSHIIRAGVKVYRMSEWKWPGLCMGKYIFLNEVTYGTPMLRHQYGHFIQSSILGPLYIPIIIIPALLWLLVSSGTAIYFMGYTEVWADRLAMKK